MGTHDGRTQNPVSGVAAFGSQDLGFRTSKNGHCSLLLLLPPCFYNASVAAFGSQDLGFRTSLACVSPPPRPAAPKCNRGRFCHRKCRDRFCQWIKMQNCRVRQTHGQTHATSEIIYKINYVQPIKWNNLITSKCKAFFNIYTYILNYVPNLLKSRSTHGSCFDLFLKKDQFFDSLNNT